MDAHQREYIKLLTSAMYDAQKVRLAGSRTGRDRYWRDREEKPKAQKKKAKMDCLVQRNPARGAKK